jgi:hypothetical protein
MIRIEFKPQDCWIGVYWKSEKLLVDIWICIIPMFPIHITHYKR